MKQVLIFGAGQVAEVFGDYLFWGKQREVAAHVVDPQFKTSDFFSQSPVITTEDLHKFPAADYEFVIGLSFKGLNAPRCEKYKFMLERGYAPLTFLDPKAFRAPDTNLGKGSFVMENNVIQPFVSIGENCVLWSGNHVGHHTKIGNHVWVSSHAVISGAVEIGDYSFIGVNATIRDGVKIGERCIIGAGALVLSDVPAGTVIQPKESERSRVPSSRVRW